jgi:RNA polymerase sigma-70 factor (sigma-E family)
MPGLGERVEGPPEDLEAFCRAQHPRVLGALILYTGDQALASELTQEAFVRVCRDWNRVRTMDRPAAWTHRVAMNLANSWFRRRRAEERAQRRHGPMDQQTDPDLWLRPAVRSAVLSVPPNERAVLVLRYFADLSVADTAVVLRLPEGTVKTRSRRGIELLRELGLLDDDREDACLG